MPGESITMVDVTAAADRIRPYIAPTPLRRYPQLCELIGTDVYVKHENFLPTGAFKVRGGVNLALQLSPDERDRGLVAASTGNHGQSVAYAARLAGTTATICVPENANPLKVAAIRGLDADVIMFGRDFDEAREHCAALADERGYRYVHSGNEPHLIAGVGTHTLEMLAEQPDLDVIIVPIGGGSGAAGACVAGKGMRPELQVIGVQSAQAPAAYRSWRDGAICEDTMSTFAEGLATRVGFELPQAILHEQLDDFVLVGDTAIRGAMVKLIGATGTLVESAGAATLAAAIQLRDRLAGKRVALVCSGGNVSVQQLKELLDTVGI